jgi:hypothetical protein
MFRDEKEIKEPQSSNQNQHYAGRKKVFYYIFNEIHFFITPLIKLITSVSLFCAVSM